MAKIKELDKKETRGQDINEYCRVALNHFFNLHTMEALKNDVFEKLNETHEKIFFRDLNSFVKKRTSLSEKKRIQVASFLGFKYEEFIALGRKLVDLKKEDGLFDDDHTDPDAFALNLSAAKTFHEIQKRHNLSDRDIAKCLDIDLMDYMFKQRGLLPFSFEEISLVFGEIGKKSPDFDDSMERSKE